MLRLRAVLHTSSRVLAIRLPTRDSHVFTGHPLHRSAASVSQMAGFGHVVRCLACQSTTTTPPQPQLLPLSTQHSHRTDHDRNCSTGDSRRARISGPHAGPINIVGSHHTPMPRNQSQTFARTDHDRTRHVGVVGGGEGVGMGTMMARRWLSGARVNCGRNYKQAAEEGRELDTEWILGRYKVCACVW